MFGLKKQATSATVDPFVELIKKYNLEGKVDCRVDINGREAKQGEAVCTFFSILQPSQGPTQPPKAFIDEAMLIIRERYKPELPMRFKVDPTGMTLEEIKKDQERWSAYCRDYYGD